MAKTSHYKGTASSGPQRVFIATPTYTGKLDAQYVFSLLYTFDRLKELGIGYEHYVMSYNCHVDDARNGIVRDFLLTDCTDLLFLDADVSWKNDALTKLIQHDRDIVAGVYPKRSLGDQEYPVRVFPGQELRADKDGLVEVDGAPTGFMKIKRHVLEKLVEANKDRQFIGRHEEGDPDKHIKYTIIFERTFEDGIRYSGDYAFCRKWRSLGGQIVVDPELFLSHIGEETFSGTLGEFWKQKYGVAKLIRQQKFYSAIEALRSGSPSPMTWIDLIAWWNNPYAGNTELLYGCYELAKTMKGRILELGTGLTTFVMALANPDIEIHSLEHSPVWGSATEYELQKLGIHNVKIHFAPLKDYVEGRWYDWHEIKDIDSFSMVLCDGPPRKISNRGILFSELHSKIEKAIVVMDDADDDIATKPIRTWSDNNRRIFTVLGKQRFFAVSKPVF